MKLKTKFLVIFSCISIIPIIIITAFTYNRYTALVSEQITQVANNMVKNASTQAASIYDDISILTEAYITEPTGSTSIVKDIKKYTVSTDYTQYDKFVLSANIKSFSQKLILGNDYINSIYLFTPSGEAFGSSFTSNNDLMPDYSPLKDDWYTKTLAQEGGICVDVVSGHGIFISKESSIIFSRAIYDIFTKKLICVLMIDTSSDIFTPIDSNVLPDMSMLYLVSDDGQTLYISKNADPKQFYLLPLSSYNNDASRVITKAIPGTGFSVVAIVNYVALYKDFNVTGTLIISIAAICVFLFIIISVFLSNYVTYPITHLSRKMSNHKDHVLLSSSKFLNRHDEIGVLYNEYNNMIDEIRAYIKEQYQDKLITLDSQMRALEAQINSHFLYNTLESINSIAEIEGVESISTMALALGDMFRYSIKTKSELVPVSDELKHVNDYMSIQKIRFEDKFQLDVDIENNVSNLLVLKLILQPIVENALYHGFEGLSRKGTIHLSCYFEEDNLYLKVADDGIGIPQEQLIKIQNHLAEAPQFSELGQRSTQSIGLKNIHSRIALYYGKDYGLSIESTQGAGTTVTIRLPVIKEGG